MMKVFVKTKITKLGVSGEEYNYMNIDEAKIYKGEKGEGHLYLKRDDKDEDDEKLRMDKIRNIEIEED